ncbi:hypothetical protein DOM22_11270 [Bdellovibrio sp. ZAP7]|uniref:hypothetical protein n=1 Tax=Bdellovibrio sp. ZAP7 TaxID=2231053 RepID=UPI00115BE264|nr:hypothetical protein [Bdellovibrio sp. ZAP7]QDK45684.1 hypothetical protein DOM22_11270 [Bdellovibrio sp. ZAP7]
MLKLSAAVITMALSFAASAHPVDGDLILEYKHYYSEFDKYVCKSSKEKAITIPDEVKDLKLSFEDLNVSIFLDNAILTAEYKEDETDCRYSALYEIDKNTKVITATESKAFDLQGDKSCEPGKNKVDQLLKKLEYVVLHEHITVKFPTTSLKEACGENSDSVLLAFKRIRKK